MKSNKSSQKYNVKSNLFKGQNVNKADSLHTVDTGRASNLQYDLYINISVQFST